MTTNVSISPKNPKLGPIASFSTPPGVTCPGASEWCVTCYAKKYFRMYKNVQTAYERNRQARTESDFVDTMIAKIKGPFFRIHVSGDFDSLEYIDQWITIAKARPDVAFWAYTRSWNVPTLVEALDRLRALPNVQLFASHDATMSAPPSGWRVAGIEGTDTVRGYACPEQNGRKANCLDCGYCFRGKRGNVIFTVH
jgi:hypothetical protein